MNIREYRHKISIFVCLVFLLATLQFSRPARAQDSTSDSDIERIVQQYVAAREAAMQANAGLEAVETLLALYLDNIVYEHPRVGIRLEGKDKQRAGMISFLGTTRNVHIEIADQIIAPGVAFLDLRVSLEARQGDSWLPVKRRQLKLLEIEDGKIRRVVEYW